jgi:deoxyribonuclease-4
MIRIGPAGTSGLGFPDGLEKCKELGLTAMEWEFTYGVRMKNEEAKKVGALAKKLGLSMSVHGPYYINLASFEKEKLEASKKRILQSCERGHYLNANYIVFHCGFYQKKEPEEIFQTIKEGVIDIQKVIKKNKWNVTLAPETTGKASQFGDADELLRLKKETGCHLTVDWSHLKARNNGKIDYDELFDKLNNLKHIHSHFSGIEWTEKGERRHLITPEQEIRELLTHIKKHKTDITIINESPDPYGDCVKTKRILESL